MQIALWKGQFYGFMSIERAFQIQGFYSLIFLLCLYFKWVIPTSGFGHVIQTTDVLIVPPRDYQLRHLAVIPLRICLVRRRPDS